MSNTNNGLLSSLESMMETEPEFDEIDDSVTVLGDRAFESELTLAAIREECRSDEEFHELVQDAAVEMALYDIIDDADVVMEAATPSKTIVRFNKKANFSKIEKRTAIRLAKKHKDPAYTKYKKYRDLWRTQRDIIYKKYGAKAKTEAKQIIMNSKRKASNMSSPAGKSITDKMERQIEKMNEKQK